MKTNRISFAAAACIVAAAFVSGCQHHRKQRVEAPPPPPIDRSGTTVYNSSELPPEVLRTDARAYRGAKVVHTGLDMGPAWQERP